MAKLFFDTYLPYVITKAKPMWAKEIDSITRIHRMYRPDLTPAELTDIVGPIFKTRVTGNFSIRWLDETNKDELHSTFWALIFDTPGDKIFWILQNSEKI